MSDPQLPAYEKLGVFYLGRPVDPASGETAAVPYLYDSKDLVTHAFCVGMTGSGKTGLGVTLLEEAALDGVPALVIDPKGDMGNLLLTFPELRGEDFAPWVDPEAARRAGQSREEHAAAQAAAWRDGLARWDEDGERIRRLRAAADFTLYTPGSSAGTPVSVLASFAAPPAALLDDADLLRDRVSTTVSSLLGLAGIDADPVRSREHILLALLFERAWRDRRDLDLAALIQQVQAPPVDKVGVMPLETFFPADDRFGLAMALNNLLASPGFASWLEGEPLDVGRLLYTAEGRPRVAVFSIAHLSEAERMFFVSLLVEQVVGWVRGQSGTSSLRALLYMDEVFGFLPPVAEPPSKRPLLTLLKQGRAYGLGVVLATQNPVDLDYKGLANIGTWFLGRLQTQRDKDRLLDGLEGVRGGFDRGETDRLLSSLDKRVFLAHNVHEEAPVLFRTRWAMSYLAGPLTREQIKRLGEGREGAGKAAAQAGAASGAAAAVPMPPAAGPATSPSAAADLPTGSAPGGGVRPAAVASPPVLPPDVAQAFLLPAGGGAGAAYRPHLLGIARVHYVDDKRGIQHTEEAALLAGLAAPTDPDWHAARALELDAERDLLPQPPAGAAAFADPPPAATEAKRYRAWEKDLADVLYRSRRLDLPAAESLGQVARPGESERDFRIRLEGAVREERDRALEELRERYAKQAAAQQERIARAGERVQREEEQAEDHKRRAWMDAGATMLGALLGRKKLSVTNVRRAGSVLSGFSRSGKEGADVDRAGAALEREREKLAEIETKLEEEAAELGRRLDPQILELGTVTVKPRRADVEVRQVLLAWVPD
jgi:DNA helicase HerA-like ATPase